MLVLPIQKRWFDMIVSGEKKEEYREVKSYYYSRFERLLSKEIRLNEYEGPVFEIVFRNGYNHISPSVKCLCSVYKGYGKEEWGAEHNKEYYILKILDIIKINNN